LGVARQQGIGPRTSDLGPQALPLELPADKFSTTTAFVYVTPALAVEPDRCKDRRIEDYMNCSYRDLRVWQLSMRLVVEIYTVHRTFPSQSSMDW